VAIIYAVREKTQSKTAMRKVMEYVAQDKKTMYEDENGQKHKLLSGQNCCGDTAFKEFIATKRRYGKEKGVYFYQYVQSFKPGIHVTPQEIHQMGVELARYFKGYEVQIATHLDRDHWHNQLVVNSVSCETGLKLQFNEKNLEQLRTLSDEICVAHGLEVLPPYQKPKQKPMSAGEYRAAVRGGSYKFKLINVIDQAMAQSRTREEFIACMKQMGYQVKWIPHHKYITYTTPEGQRCRDNKLHETKYLKAEMEGYFSAKLRGIETAQQAGKPSGRTYGTDSHTALPATGQRHTHRPMEHDVGEPDRSHPAIAGIDNACIRSAYRGRCKQYDEELLPEHLRQADRFPFENDSGGASADDEYSDYEYEQDDGYDWMEADQYTGALGGEAAAQGHVAAQNQGQMGRHRGIDFDDIVALAKAIDDLVNPYNPEEERQKKKKYVPKSDHKKQKKKHHSHSHDYDFASLTVN
jgi:hypothetical protein